ncbi:MAG: arsenate reductase ArsC [Acidobacteria bacterium]|nr:arsenate reductase ArsC [Acidobacteriota bacterium]
MKKPTVLFLCVHNAGRSQMAAGWLAHLAGDAIEACSAGSDPGEEINPAATAAMSEVGIDISSQRPQRWTDDMAHSADVIVSMGCGDECPIYDGVRREAWQLEDPAGQPIEFVRVVRDDIRFHVETLIESMEAPSS